MAGDFVDQAAAAGNWVVASSISLAEIVYLIETSRLPVQQRGRWKGLWYENGVKKRSIVGLCKDMMTIDDIRKVFGALAQREASICKLAVLAGMRAGRDFCFKVAVSVKLSQR